VDFESTAIPGYAISAADVGFSATVISMVLPRSCMEIHLKGRDYDVKVEIDGERTVRKALLEAGILPSTVIVSYDGTILPHATVLSQSVKLLVTTISSGG
jgi:sulfur carrier protein ThiS|tara:strand:+ start:1174 stop:1473 length:300 start_codon:yes stop_codon:yes gene_type:complete